jgi:hypothetical protein
MSPHAELRNIHLASLAPLDDSFNQPKISFSLSSTYHNLQAAVDTVTYRRRR